MIEERYIKNIPSLSEEECSLLRRKCVLVAGCGGLGGYAIELLLRAGVGRIVAVDGDVFQMSNLNRQLLSEDAWIGKNKAEAAAARAKQIAPQAEVRAVSAYLDAVNAGSLIAGCNAAVDALDNIPSRRTLVRACGEAGIPVIHGAVRGWNAQAAVLMPGDGLLDRMYPDGAPATCEESTLAVTAALCSAMQASLCVQVLCGRAVAVSTVHYADVQRLTIANIGSLI